MRKLLVLNVAALSPAEITGDTPTLKAFAESGMASPLVAPFPALTCTSHATMMTGSLPSQHGIVGNGWYDREHAKVLDADAQREVGIEHSRSGELVAVADAKAWFAYPYWLASERAPDFANCIAIFDKASFDPCELFPRPGLFGKPLIALRVAQKMARLTVPFDVIDPDPSNVHGARNIANDEAHGASLVTSWSREPHAVPMQALRTMLIERMFSA